MGKYLDKAGLQIVFSKIKQYITTETGKYVTLSQYNDDDEIRAAADVDLDERLQVFEASTYALQDHTHTVDATLSSTSTNPVQNKVINSALSQKAPSSHTSAKADKTTYGHVVVDDALSSTSTNPVQNKVINSALAGKQATITGAATTITSNNLTSSYALISNSSGKVAVSNVTSTELNYLDGVTSNVQTQLDGKAPSSHTTVAASTNTLGHVKVDSSLSSSSTNPVQNKAINTALSGKQDTITGAATTITSNNLTSSYALISNADGKVAVSGVTSTELGYLDGVTSNVQTQLDNKAPSTHTTVAASTDTLGHVKVDASLSSTSTNPVQNKAINTALAGKQAKGNYTTTSGTVTKDHIVVFNANTTTSGAATVIKDSGFTIGKSVPSNAVFTDTDTKVQQVSTNGNAKYPLLFKNSSSNDGETNAVRYDSDGLTNSYYNPGTNTLYVTYAYTTALYQSGKKVSVEGHTHTVDTALSSSSTNPVQNKVINTALAGKAPSSHTSEKATATTYGHVIVDDELNATSTNPVQNNVINTALAGKAASSHTSVKATSTTYGHVVIDEALNASSTNPVQNKAINTALSGKQTTITGAATTITSSNLTVSRALISDSSGKVAVSGVTSTELGYLDGVTSNVQTQIDSKAPSSHTSAKADKTTYGHVVIDEALSSSSTNPVQNKVINSALAGKQTTGNYTTTSGTVTASHVAVFNAATTTSGAATVIKDSGFTIGKSVPSNAVFTDTDTKVQQTGTSANAKYPLLLKYTDNTTDETKAVRYDSDGTTNSYYNPGTNTLYVTYAYTTALYQNGTKVSVEGHTHNYQAPLTFDNVPTDGSSNPVKSDGIYDALAGKQAKGNYTTTSGKATASHVVVFNAATTTSGAATVIKDSGFTIGKSVPSNAVFTDTDTKVSQVSTTDNANYPLLFKNSNNNTAETASIRYDSDGTTNSYYNPSTNSLYVKTAYTTSLYQNGTKVSVEGHTHNYQAPLTFDNAPTDGSSNPVKSDGIYDALAGKQATITGGATTITGSNLTASRALISNSSGKVAVSDVTSTELGYLDGVTSNVQTQLDNKAPSTHTTVAASTTVLGHVKVDNALSTTSTNPVQNKVINTAISAKYTKPSGGIPKTDLASGVQTSLDKADAAVSNVTINNDSVRVTKNGTNTDLTVPYATQSTNLRVQSLSNENNGASEDTIVSVHRMESDIPSFPTTNNANAILDINTHPGKYNHEIGFSSNGSIYHRYRGGSFNTWSEIVTNNSLYEANLLWGGKNFSGSYGPIDAAMIGDLGANRSEFLNGQYVSVEYSRDDGATWTDYGESNANKGLLFSKGYGFIIGKPDSGTVSNAHCQLRITIINTKNASLYTILNKFALYISTEGSNGCWCSIDGRIQDNVTNNVDTWSNFCNKSPISGWSGWNIINTASFSTYTNFSDRQFGQIRFTFGCTSYTGNGTNQLGLHVYNIKCFGGVGWSTPSNMAKNGHLYSWDGAQVMYVPNGVRPSSNNTQTLGWSNARWSNVYSVLGNFSGMITADGGITVPSGKNITVGGKSVLTEHQSLKTINSNTITGTGNISIATPGTLKTNATTAQTASSGEAMSGTITLHKISKTGAYADLIGAPTIPSAPGTLKTNATTAQTTSAGEAMSGTITLHKVSKTGSYNDLNDKPTIPSAVTESTVSGWGFTKNAGTVTSVKINGTAKNPTSGVVDLGTVVTSETALSKGTTSGSGNAVTDISVSGHQITLTKGKTFLESETQLSKGTTSGSGNAVTDISVSGHQITLTKDKTFLTSHQSIKTINNNTITGTGNVTIATPGTLKTDATTAQTASSSEVLSGTITLHKISKTGSYNDLLNKPTIPAAPGTLKTDATTAQTASSSEALSGTITLHKVSKTGSYNDLLNKPTIPAAANDSVVKISGAGTTVSAFTLNSSTERTISFTGQNAGSNASGVSADYASITTTAGGLSNSATLTITTNATSDSYMPWGDDDDALSTESVVAALASGGLFDVADIEMNIYGEPDEDNSYLYFVNPGTSNVQINLRHTQTGSPSTIIKPVISYSFNKTTWTNMAAPAAGKSTSVTGPTLTPGQKVYFKGTNEQYSLYTLSSNAPTSTCVINQFHPTGPVYCGGNVMSMIYGDKFRGKKDIKKPFALSRLFADNDANLLSAPILPATILSQWCYYAMFTDDSALKNPPVLPARFVPIGAYSRMFYGCPNLKTAPDLPATRIGVRSYYEMFQGCTSLTGNPTIYAMMTNNSSFAYMFCNCSSLNNITIRTMNTINGNGGTNNDGTATYWPCTYMLYGTAANGVLTYIDGSDIYTKYSANTGKQTLVPTSWTFEAFSYSFTNGQYLVN